MPFVEEEQLKNDVKSVMVVMILVLRTSWKSSLSKNSNLKITVNSELVEISDDQE